MNKKNTRNIKYRYKMRYFIILIASILIVFGIYMQGLIYFKKINAVAQTENEYGFFSGTGLKEDPFIIKTPLQLDNMRNYFYKENPEYDSYDSNGASNSLKTGADEVKVAIPKYLPYYFELGANIDLKDALDIGGDLYNDGKGWLPIDRDARNKRFYGHLNGQGYTIFNLWIDRPDYQSVGLFSCLNNSSIKNLNLVLDEKGIIGKSIAGGLAGEFEIMSTYNMMGAVIYNPNVVSMCSVEGNIKAVEQNSYVGGLMGIGMESIITKSYFKGVLESNGIVGGIIGYAAKVTVEDSYVNIDIISENKDVIIGGVFGSAASWGSTNSEIINNNISKAYVNLNTHLTGDVFAGDVKHVFDVSYSYYKKNNNLGLTTKYLLTNVLEIVEENKSQPSAYQGFDFDSVWGFDNNGDLVLRYFGNAFDPAIPPLPYDFSWLYIVLGCLLFVTIIFVVAIIVHKHKKVIVVTQTETIIKEVVKPRHPLPNDLSEQERCVANKILQGKSRRQVAEEMGLSDGTIKTYMIRIYIKAGVDNQKEFIARYLGGEEKEEQ